MNVLDYFAPSMDKADEISSENSNCGGSFNSGGTSNTSTGCRTVVAHRTLGTYPARLGTAPKHRGYSYSKHNYCRYCPTLNKTGKSPAQRQGLLECITKISCSSSNRIHCITCTRCNIFSKQLVSKQISVLEFIRKPPKSPASIVIRNRVERRWMHLLRTSTPHGLNVDD